MYRALKITALLLCLAFVKASPKHTPLAGQRNLMTFMMQTRDISNEHPQRSLECFGYYVPLLNDITAEYERSYAACLNFAEQQKADVDNATLSQRKEIESSAKDACQLLQDCSAIKPAEPYFECYISAGSDNSKTMYTISSNASIARAEVVEMYRLIDNDKYRCTNASERAYVENTSKTYDELQDCLTGKTAVPETPTESTTTPTEPTTVPTETTAEPTESAFELNELPKEHAANNRLLSLNQRSHQSKMKYN